MKLNLKRDAHPAFLEGVHSNKQTNLEIVVCLDLAPNRRPHQMTLEANQILFLLNFFRQQKATGSLFLLCGFDPVKKN